VISIGPATSPNYRNETFFRVVSEADLNGSRLGGGPALASRARSTASAAAVAIWPGAHFVEGQHLAEGEAGVLVPSGVREGPPVKSFVLVRVGTKKAGPCPRKLHGDLLVG